MSEQSYIEFMDSLGLKVDAEEPAVRTKGNDYTKEGVNEIGAMLMASKRKSRATGKTRGAKAQAIHDNLSGQDLEIGFGQYTIKTGIGMSPGFNAAMIGMGDQIGDAYRGIMQIVKRTTGIDSINEKIQDSNEQILRELYGDARYGGAALTGAVVGAVAEPVGLLLIGGKVAKGVSVGKAALGASAMGAVYGSSLYVDGEESRIKNAAVGAILGGAVGGIAQKWFGAVVGDDVANMVKRSQEFDDRLVYAGVHEKTGKPHYTLKPEKKVKEKKKTSGETMAEMEVRSATEGKKQSKMSATKDVVDQAIQPLYDAIHKIKPAVAKALRNTDGTQHINMKKWTDRTMGWNKWVKSLSGDKGLELKKILSNEGMTNGAIKWVQNQGGDKAVKAATEVKTLLKEIMQEYKNVGYKIEPLDFYFPNSVKDLDSLVKKQQGIIQKSLSKAQSKKGKPLTRNEKNHIAERMFSFDIKYSTTAGSLKNRKKLSIADDEMEFYHDPINSLHYYLATAAEDIAKRKFFKEFGYTAGKKGLNVNGADIGKSINNILDSMKDLSAKDQSKMYDFLSSRFSADVHKTHKFIRGLKNLSYAGTLGNWWSAMTQLGDPIFALHKYGIRASAEALLGPKVTSKEMIGLEKAMQELVSEAGTTASIADWAFKWSGFNKVDAFGKNINMNASLRLNKRLAKDPVKFKKQWGEHFGDETESLMRELQNLKLKKNADLSDNALLMLWNDLADTQPIGLTEMPKKYLDMPNGRIVYAYKTFAMKQFNYMRNILNKEGRSKFNRGADLAYFGAMFVGANATIDQFKDFMGGRDLDFEDKLTDNLFSLAGTSKYVVDKSAGLGDIVMEGLTPVPFTQAKDVWNKTQKNITKGDVGQMGIDAFNQLPIIGKLNKEWGMLQ